MADINASIQKARDQGYSESEISDFLSQSNPKIGDAVKEGYSLDEIASHLSNSPQAKPPISQNPTLASRASDFAIKGISLPLVNPITKPFEQAGEMVNKSVQDVSSRIPESGYNPLKPVVSMLGDMGKLTPTNMALNVGGELAGKVALPAIANTAGRGIASTEGLLTGTGDAVKTAFKAGEEGGAAQEALIKTMRGTTAEQSTVNDALNSLQNIKQARAKAYVSKMEEIQGKSFQKKIDLEPVKTKLDDLLNDYNISRDKNGAMDFSRAALDDPAIADVKRIAETVDNWGTKAGDNTVKGMDILKRKIDDFWSASGEARAFVSSLRNKVKSTIIDAVPDYEKMTKGYETASNSIKVISKELSMGANSNSGTVMRKLKQSLRQNFDLRKAFVSELDKAGKSHIMEQIAGTELSPITPKGMMRTVAGGDILASLGLHNPSLLAGLPLTSPRLVGEAALKAGQASRFVRPIFGGLNKVPASAMALRAGIRYPTINENP